MPVGEVRALYGGGTLSYQLDIEASPTRREKAEIRPASWDVEVHETLEATRGQEDGLNNLGLELAYVYFRSFGREAPLPPLRVWERMKAKKPYDLDLRRGGLVLDVPGWPDGIRVLPYEGRSGSLGRDEYLAVLKNKDGTNNPDVTHWARGSVQWKDVDYFYNPQSRMRLDKADLWLGKINGLEQRFRNAANTWLSLVRDTNTGEILGALEGVVRTVGVEPQGLVWNNMLREELKDEVRSQWGIPGFLDLPQGLKLGSANDIYVLPEARGNGVAASLVSTFCRDNHLALFMVWSKNAKSMMLLDSVLGGSMDVFIGTMPMRDYPLNAYVLWWLAALTKYDPPLGLINALKLKLDGNKEVSVPAVKMPKGFLARPPVPFDVLASKYSHLWPIFLVQEYGSEGKFMVRDYTMPVLACDPRQLPRYRELEMGKMRGLEVLATTAYMGGRMAWLDQMLRQWIKSNRTGFVGADKGTVAMENGYGGILTQGVVAALISMVDPVAKLGQPSPREIREAGRIKRWAENHHSDLAKYVFPVFSNGGLDIDEGAGYHINQLTDLWVG